VLKKITISLMGIQCLIRATEKKISAKDLQDDLMKGGEKYF